MSKSLQSKPWASGRAFLTHAAGVHAPEGAGDSGVYPRDKRGAAARRTEGSLDPLGPLGSVRIQEKYQQKPRNFSFERSICGLFAVYLRSNRKSTKLVLSNCYLFLCGPSAVQIRPLRPHMRSKSKKCGPASRPH